MQLLLKFDYQYINKGLNDDINTISLRKYPNTDDYTVHIFMGESHKEKHIKTVYDLKSIIAPDQKKGNFILYGYNSKSYTKNTYVCTWKFEENQLNILISKDFILTVPHDLFSIPLNEITTLLLGEDFSYPENHISYFLEKNPQFKLSQILHQYCLIEPIEHTNFFVALGKTHLETTGSIPSENQKIYVRILWCPDDETQIDCPYDENIFSIIESLTKRINKRDYTEHLKIKLIRILKTINEHALREGTDKAYSKIMNALQHWENHGKPEAYIKNRLKNKKEMS